ncbi:MAG: efflux RND transporter periplasmic adaptor subunit [Candidatus Omnitrophica bacterium]|nr:efflux RND transporter periplasmic adaptor subunit [Candidatus Omnitrophota bacterium]
MQQKWPLFQFAYMAVLAYLAALAVYQIGRDDGVCLNIMNAKILRYIIVVVCILVVAGGTSAWSRDKNVAHGPTRGAQNAQIYYCPMHPRYTSDRPGKCPVCGMDRVKKESQVSKESAGVAGDHAAVQLSGYQQQLLGVKLTPVVKKPFVKTIRVYGYVVNDMDLYKAELRYIEAWREYAPFRRSRLVKDEFPDDWGEFPVRAPGEDFRNARERTIKAEYELRHMGFQDAQLEQLRLIKYELADIQPETLFGQKWHPLLIHARIFEEDLGYVDVGQKAIVDIPAYRESFEGIVRSVGDEVDPQTRTVIVRIELPKAKEYLKVNMYANVLMPVELNDVLMISRDAVMNTGLRQIVFCSAR